jgi:hypothetical protein
VRVAAAGFGSAPWRGAAAQRTHFVPFLVAHATTTLRCCLLLWARLQGNRAGVVGCGFWNNNCGGLDIALVWEIVYCIIAGLIVIVFPFFIFYYENDDEGMSAEEESGGSCIARCCNFGNFKRSLGVAFCYTVATAALAALVVFLMYNYLKQTSIPYKLTSIGVGTVAFRPGTRACACAYVFVLPAAARAPVGGPTAFPRRPDTTHGHNTQRNQHHAASSRNCARATCSRHDDRLHVWRRVEPEPVPVRHRLVRVGERGAQHGRTYTRQRSSPPTPSDVHALRGERKAVTWMSG